MIVAWNHHQYGPIGIDLGTHTLRAVQLAVTGTRVEVVAAAHIPAEGDLLDPSRTTTDLAPAIKRLLGQGGFHGKRIVSALPLTAIRIKNLRLPCMPESELDDAVRFEALERFQSLGSDPQVRYFKAGTVSGTQGDQFELVVIGVSGDVIRGFLGTVAQLGLRCEGLCLSPAASFRPFERRLKRQEDSDQVRALLDIGHDGSRLVLARSTEIAFIKLLDVGAARLCAAAAETLSIEGTEATRLLSTMGDGASNDARKPQRLAVMDAVAPDVDRLGKEVGLCLRYFAVTFRGMRTTEVVCVGEAARNTAVLERLAGVIGVPVRPGDPFHGIATEHVFAGTDRRIGQPEWATALGLALKRLEGSPYRGAPRQEAVVA